MDAPAIRHFTASAIVFDDLGRVLLVHHKTLGKWLQPGGHIEPNEDPAQAALREVREETGVEADIVADDPCASLPIEVVPPPMTIHVQDVFDSRIGIHQHIDHLYVCRARSTELVHQPEEVNDCRWVRPEDVASIDTPPELASLIAIAATYLYSARL